MNTALLNVFFALRMPHMQCHRPVSTKWEISTLTIEIFPGVCTAFEFQKIGSIV